MLEVGTFYYHTYFIQFNHCSNKSKCCTPSNFPTHNNSHKRKSIIYKYVKIWD